MKTYYITKWALTNGIESVSDKQATVDEDGYLHFRRRGNAFADFLNKRHWTEDLTEAKARVEMMRQAKVAQLRKALKKLEAYEASVRPIETS